jgi:hypothetical protein
MLDSPAHDATIALVKNIVFLLDGLLVDLVNQFRSSAAEFRS